MKVRQIDEFGQPDLNKGIPQWNEELQKFEYITVGVLIAANLEEKVFDFVDPSDIWVVNHGIDGYPDAIILDSANTIVYSRLEYNTDDKQIIIRHGASFSGRVVVKLIKK